MTGPNTPAAQSNASPARVPALSLSLDHVGLIVPDLEAARALWSDLGFTLTRRADHTRTGPDGQRVPAGSAQHSVMLETGYIELMQITDPLAGHPLTPAMQQRFGLHILALATEDPKATHAALAARGCALSPVMDWSRPVSEEGAEGLARFQFFDTPWQASDASYFCWVRHMTPELMRPPALLTHANGAQALRGLTYEGSPASCEGWRARLASLAVDLRDGLRVVATAPSTQVLPVAIEVAFADLGELADRARRCGIEPKPVSGGLQLDLGPRSPIRIDARSAPSA